MTGGASHHRARVLLAIMLLSAGCAAPPAPSPPRLPPTAAPTIEAQDRLLHTARSHLSEGSYAAAGDVLRRLIETQPQSPLLLEAHWLLAQSYEQAGDLYMALAQYRLLVTIAKEDSYGGEARGRIAELEKQLGPTAIRSSGLIAILLPLQDLPSPQELDPWVRALGQAGITSVLVEGGTVTLRSALSQLVPIAHRHGLSVFAATTLRRMTGVDLPLDWADWSYDPAQRQLRPSPNADLFHPAFQEYLIGFLTDLAGTGVDGVLFRADAPLGPTEGFSASALRGFERDFQLRLDPDQLFPPSTRGAPAIPPRDAQDQEKYPPDFWRWAGWKARESLKVMDRLRGAMRKQSPRLRFALEVHPEAVTNPVEALARYGEDLLEAKRNRFDFYLTGPRPGISELRPGINERTPGIIERMIDLIGDAERIWVATPLPAGASARLAQRVPPTTNRDAFAKGVGLIYVGTVVPVP
ncbi:MAG: tetratricopeptide repeat protein [Candidatus Methylomirabilaceae bacterium]